MQISVIIPVYNATPDVREALANDLAIQTRMSRIGYEREHDQMRDLMVENNLLLEKD